MKRWIWIAAIAAALWTQNAAADAYDKLQAALAAGNFAGALKIVVPLAERGEARAQYELGMMYGHGQGVPKDFVTGCMWLNLSAFEQGLPPENACENILLAMSPAQWLQYRRPVWWSAAEAGIPDDPAACPNVAGSAADGLDECVRIARYLSTPGDTVITRTTQTVLETSIRNPSAQSRRVLVIADGTADPTGPANASLQILVDDHPVGTAPGFDWRTSPDPAAHSYSAIAVADLAPGDHKVSLIAHLMNPGRQRAVTITAGSNLAIMTSTARQVQSATLDKASRVFSTLGRGIPVYPYLSLPKPVQGPAALLSGANASGDGGDAMLGISPDGTTCPWAGDQNFSVNDIVDQAERTAPFFVAGLATDTGTSSPAAFASVFPWPLQHVLDPVHFRVAAGSLLLSVEHPHLLGAGYNSEFRNRPCSTVMYRCIASSQGFDFCPKIDEQSTIASAQIVIDNASDGVLMVIATTVPTADHDDQGGTVMMGLRIDGVDVGSVGVQELPRASVESARTLTASYLADTDHRLSPGPHQIEVWAAAKKGSQFKWLSVPKQLTLLFFD